MNINTDKIVSISDANRNFSQTARLADKLGEVYIFKNNKPKYKLTVISEDELTAGLPAEPSEGQEVSKSKLDRLMALIRKYRSGLEELLRISDKQL